MARDSRLRAWSLARFRPARPAGASHNLFKTAFQTVVFWATFLWVAPLVIARVEAIIGIPGFGFPTQDWSPWIGFAAASALGLWSGATMAVAGRGTPLPVDCPRRLVVQGPYRFVRNPMAVAGLAQGAFVGLLIGSWSTLAYVAAGGVLWNTVVRPIEEDDLEHRFGASFVRYRDAVRCWLPRPSPYR